MIRYVIFVVAALSLVLGGIGATSLAVAFPVLTSSFNASMAQAGQVLYLFQLFAAVGFPLGGKASDTLGRKFAFLLAVALYTIGSLLSAVAPNIQLLIVFRCIQGLGGGGLIPTATGVVAETLPEKRQQFIGLLGTLNTVGIVTGPTLGGWLVSAFGWRSVFWFNVAMGVFVLLISAVLLKSGARRKAQIDLKGMVLLTGTLLTLLIGLSRLRSGQAGLSWLTTGLLIVAGIGLAIALIRHLRREKNAVIDWRLLSTRRFLAANVYAAISGVGTYALMAFVPLYAVSVYGLSTLQSGLVMTPRPLGTIVVSAIGSVFIMRLGYRRPMMAGAVLLAASYALLAMEPAGGSLLGIQISSMSLLFGIMFLSGLAGVSGPAFNNARIDLMPERAASIAGVGGMFTQIGGTVGLAVISLLLNNVDSMALGFSIVFFGLAALTVASFPLIFVLPKSPRAEVATGADQRH